MKKVAICIFAAIFALVGILFMFSQSVDTSKDPENLAEMSYEDMEKGSIYYVEELVVLDQFASMEDDVMYMTVVFLDEDEEIVAMNMPVNKDDEIWDDVYDYMDDSSLGYGDLVLDGYVLTETDVDVQGKLHDYFDDQLEFVESQLGTSVCRTDLRFDFLCDKDGDPYEIAAGQDLVGKIVGGLMIVAALGIVYIGVLRKPKQTTAFTAPAYTPAQPAYTPAQQPTHAPQQPVYQPQAQNTMAGADPKAEQINRYRALVNAGVMSEEEFEKKRQELLGL